ncbi:hypothetical protein GCM10010193_61250 [Kitasatospora atroaurantiaca]
MPAAAARAVSASSLFGLPVLWCASLIRLFAFVVTGGGAWVAQGDHPDGPGADRATGLTWLVVPDPGHRSAGTRRKPGLSGCDSSRRTDLWEVDALKSHSAR